MSARPSKPWAFGALLGAWCSVAVPSFAAPAETPVRLEYQAPGGCPSRDEFWQRVEGASKRLRSSETDAGARAYRVTLRASRGGFQGELLELGQAAPRVLDGARCPELADALALMLALSADPGLSDATTPEPATPEAPTPEPATPESAAPEASTSPLLEPSANVESTKRPANEPVAPASAPRPRSAPAHGSGSFLWAGPLALFGAAPDAMLGAALGYDRVLVRYVAVGGSLRGALAVGSLSERHLALSPEVCARLAVSVGEVRGCAGAALGFLWVHAVEYRGNQSKLWLAPRGGLRLRRLLVGSLWLELAADLELPLVRRSYFVKAQNEGFSTPTLASEVALLWGGEL